MAVSVKALVTHCQSGIYDGGLWVVAERSNIINKNSGWKKPSSISSCWRSVSRGRQFKAVLKSPDCIDEKKRFLVDS